jgi:L-ascorbate metabolism protein UlaG (beta-lactamase superfamily)
MCQTELTLTILQDNLFSMFTKIDYLGHSTVILDFNGVRVITDPVFRRRIFHLTRTAPLPESVIYQDIDIVLVSHLHYDHLDIQSIRSLGDGPLVCVPKGAGNLLRKNGISNFRELVIGEEFSIGNIPVRTTYARHRNSRHPLGMQAECMGFLVGNEITIYYPGDTQIFPEMASISDRIDVALMPVWGWGPHLGRMHMSPVQAAEAMAYLKPNLAIPIHWGTYLPIGLAWLKPDFHSSPPLVFADSVKKNHSEVEVRILKPGESTIYFSS